MYGGSAKFQDDPHWRDLILFYEYFHGDNGAGLGASHQTGWTGVIARLMDVFGRLDKNDALDVSKSTASARHGARRVRTATPTLPQARALPKRPPRDPDESAALSGAVPGQHASPTLRAGPHVRAARRRSTMSLTTSSTRSRGTASTSSGFWASGRPARLRARCPHRTRTWLAEYRRVLPDFDSSDVTGSPFAVRDYHVHADFGGDAALARLRARLAERGLRLMLDFVPNHVAPDHPWLDEHPDFFIEGTEEQLAAQPQNWRRISTARGERILAYGRDPYFAGWPDTLQLNYANPALQDAMLGGAAAHRHAMRRRPLRHGDAGAAGRLRAHLGPGRGAVLAARDGRRPRRTTRLPVHGRGVLGSRVGPPAAGLRLHLRQAPLRPTARGLSARPVREHLYAGLDFQDRLARFLENHDEPRAAATFEPDVSTAPQRLSRSSRRACASSTRDSARAERCASRCTLGEGLTKGTDSELAAFYDRLLACLDQPAFRDGEWQLARRAQRLGRQRLERQLHLLRAGPDRATSAASWPSTTQPAKPVLRRSCRGPTWPDRTWRLVDALGDESMSAMAMTSPSSGLYLDLRPWGFNVFEVRRASLADGA